MALNASRQYLIKLVSKDTVELYASTVVAATTTTTTTTMHYDTGVSQYLQARFNVAMNANALLPHCCYQIRMERPSTRPTRRSFAWWRCTSRCYWGLIILMLHQRLASLMSWVTTAGNPSRRLCIYVCVCEILVNIPLI